MFNLRALRESQSVIKPVEDRRTLGIALVILALITFTGLDTCAKFLVTNGMPSVEVVFARYAVHLFLVIAVLLPLQGRTLVKTQRPGLEVLRALSLLGATVSNFFAVKYLPLTTTSAIFFAMPLVLSALSGPLLGEHVGIRRWSAVIVGLIGVLIIIQPGGASFHWAMIFSLGAVLATAFYNILNRKLAGVDSANTQQFYAAMVATLAIMPFAFFEWVWPDSGLEWAAFLGMGVFGGVGHLMHTTAHRMAEASALAPFAYVQILFMTAASWFVFGEAPDFWIYVGAPIVVGSGLYIWLRERHLERSIDLKL